MGESSGRVSNVVIFHSYKVYHPCAGPLRKQHFDVSTPSGDSWTNFVPLKLPSSVERKLRGGIERESAFRKLER